MALDKAGTIDVKVAIVAAVARNGVIGADNDLPWRLREDMLHFKAVTKAKPVIMGRKTWESLPRRPLPGRANLVVSRQHDFDAPGAFVFPSIETALAAAKAMAVRAQLDEVCVIGGGAIYSAAMAFADRLYVTDVDAAPEGQIYFPKIDEAVWEGVQTASHQADTENDHNMVMRTYNRRK